ncbi:MAG: DUF3999 domain-containing protein, partial [Ignavibacteria bacterium]|nr:DUF3999 domain-containing protein [Ignavibacteria bacterium]
MNSRQTLSVGVLLLAAVPSQLLGGFAMQDWKYFKTLRADTSAYYVRIILDRETFEHARPDVSDLRVVDSAGHEVPYQLIRGSEWHTVEQRGARVLNISHAPGKYSVVVLDVGKSGKAHNVVDLDIASHNYRRNVRLFGSDDARRWFVLRDDVAVFDFSTADDSVRVNRIRYPESIYRYLKIHVMNGSEPPLLIRSATLAVESEPARTLRNYDATTVSVRHDANR